MDKPISDQKEFYDKRWSVDKCINNIQFSRMIFILKSIYALDVNCPNMLDFGSGTGWLTGILNNIGPTLGIELSSAAVGKAQKNNPNVSYIQGDFFSHEFEKNCFDIVVSHEVIEHVVDQKQYLDIAYSCLKPGGHLIITTPNATNFNSWSREQLNEWGMQPIENWLSKSELALLLSRLFEIKSLSTIITGYGSQGFYKFVNSTKLNSFFRQIHVDKIFEHFLLTLGLGLHLVAIAKKEEV